MALAIYPYPTLHYTTINIILVHSTMIWYMIVFHLFFAYCYHIPAALPQIPDFLSASIRWWCWQVFLWNNHLLPSQFVSFRVQYYTYNKKSSVRNKIAILLCIIYGGGLRCVFLFAYGIHIRTTCTTVYIYIYPRLRTVVAGQQLSIQTGHTRWGEDRRVIVPSVYAWCEHFIYSTVYRAVHIYSVTFTIVCYTYL